MSNQYFGERIIVSDTADRDEAEQDDPNVKWDLTADQVQVDELPVEEKLVDEAVVDATPFNEPLADTRPMEPVMVYESFAQVNPTAATPEIIESLVETPVNAAPVTPVTPQVAPTTYVAPVTHDAPVVPAMATPATLLNHEDAEHFRTRWNEIQGTFVDEPRKAVEQADTLVADVIGQITRMFTDEHGVLESQWKQGNEVSTEELRKALQHYRAFFNRLVV